jgi:preprotein translocase subunit SecF
MKLFEEMDLSSNKEINRAINMFVNVCIVLMMLFVITGITLAIYTLIIGV